MPSQIGITPSGALPLHTHDDSGLIHVESPKRKTFKLKDFFKVWGQPLSKKLVLDHALTKNERVTILVNGAQSKGVGSQVLHDHDVILVKVEPKPTKGK